MPPLHLHVRHAEAAPVATQIDKDEAKTNRQAALSKAMGTLFLQHRVASLEADVDGLAFHRGSSGCHRRAAPAGKSDQRRERGDCATHAAGPSREAPKPTLPSRETYVVDASVLIYSLRSVHEWLKRGDVCVIVPQEVLSTLDVLKKGEHALNLAARKATRFLEERLASPGATRENGGLVPQRDGERCTLEEAEGLRAVCAATCQVAGSSSAGSGRASGESGRSAASATLAAPASRRSHESARSSTSSRSSPHRPASSLPPAPVSLRYVPHAMRELLLCALHFPSAHLALAHPPLHLSTTDVAPISSTHDLTAHARQSPRYLERVDGAATERLAVCYGVSVCRCRTADSWIELGRTGELPGKKERKRSGEGKRR